MTLKLVFKLGQSVWLKSDQDDAGIVTGIVERPQSTAYHYLVSWADGETEHYDCELLAERSYKSGAFTTEAD